MLKLRSEVVERIKKKIPKVSTFTKSGNNVTKNYPKFMKIYNLVNSDLLKYFT